VTAALLLASRGHLRRLGLPHASVEQILGATGATRSRTYELQAELLGLLSTIERPVGRPQAEPPTPEGASSVTQEVLRFVMQHPGCVHQRARRQRYSDSFRAFLLELHEKNKQMRLESFAQTAQVPLGTMKDWLRGGHTDTDTPTPQATAVTTDPATAGRIETILEQWRSWKGDFVAFCDHISFNLRIPYGRTLIASILEQHGERSPHRRQGRSPDEKALRGAFETFFPGAQWQGDGTPIEVQINQERFHFNLELMVDAFCDAFVGVSFRDEEDSTAVIEASDDGVSTTGAPPLATLLDNRPSNHTPEVEQALQPSLCMHATKGRAQNKAHVEGGFGLFAQTVPALAIIATSPKEMARQIAQIVCVTFMRTLNHKPRRNRCGRSRVDIYKTETPTPEQIAQARAALEERVKQQEKARKTLQARQNPVVRAILDDAFSRLVLKDPQGNIRAAIARYSIDAVVNGIATFEGKRHAGTLPEGVDARYLLGIVRNISQQGEGLQITEALLIARLDAQDRLLEPLRCELDSLQMLHSDPAALLKALLDHVTVVDRHLDRLFWLTAVVNIINGQSHEQHAPLLRHVSRRIHAAFAMAYRERLAAIRFVASRVILLQ
jgi:hypothetical protein